MAVGGSDASSSIGVIGEVLKAPKIRLDAVFWSVWSLLMYPFCSLHQASTPKSRIGRTQVIYSCRRCRELSPHSLVFNLEDIWSALEAEAIFLSIWALKLSFLSKKTPSHRTTVEGFIMVPLGIIIIIFHFMLAAYRLWQNNLHLLGIQPIFSLSPPCFLSAIVLSSSYVFSFV